MNIDDNHLYHGAALIQIAEHPQFTAINSLKIKTRPVENAYKINDHIAVWFKYAVKPNKNYKEYAFTFSKDQIDQLKVISENNDKLFLGLVCVKDREICCLSYLKLTSLIDRRVKAISNNEDQYTILVTAPKNKSLRVYVNAPGRKKTILGKTEIVKRTAFPNELFS
jgi:predicted transcriptional regulator